MAEVQVQVIEYDGYRGTGQSVQVPIELAARRGPKSTNGPPGVCVLIECCRWTARELQDDPGPSDASPCRAWVPSLKVAQGAAGRSVERCAARRLSEDAPSDGTEAKLERLDPGGIGRWAAAAERAQLVPFRASLSLPPFAPSPSLLSTNPGPPHPPSNIPSAGSSCALTSNLPSTDCHYPHCASALPSGLIASFSETTLSSSGSAKHIKYPPSKPTDARLLCRDHQGEGGTGSTAVEALLDCVHGQHAVELQFQVSLRLRGPGLSGARSDPARAACSARSSAD